MATEKFKLFEADIDVDGVIKKSVELKEETIKLRQDLKALKITVGENNEEYIRKEARLKSVRREYNLNQKQVQNLSDTNGELLTVQQKLTTALDKEVKSVTGAIKNNKELRTLRNDIDVTTREGAEAVEQLNKKIDENTELIKENSSALERLKLNIGNYKEDIKGAFDELNIFNGGLSGFIERANAAGGAGNLVSNSIKGMTKGLIGLTKATVAFILTPIGALLAVLVGAFLLVRNAMNRSEEATNKINKIFAIFSGIINKVLQALEPLGEFLIDGIVAGFELAAAAADKAIGIISSGLKLLGFDDAAESVEGWYGEMKVAVKQAQALADAQARLEKEQRKAQLVQLEYQRDAEKLRQIRDNENLSIRERIQANEELGIVLQKQLAEELRIAQLALEVANLRIEAEGETTEALDEQAEAMTRIADIQERITGQESEQLTNRVALQKEAADKAKELADKAIAEQEAQLELFLQQQGIRAKSYEEQLKILEETYRRELEIVEANLKNRNLTETEAEAERLRLKNELLQERNDLITDQAQRELDIYIQMNQSKIDSDLYFSEESLRIEEERLNNIRDKQQEFFEEQLELGKINQQDYNDAINKINEENRIALEEAQTARDEAQKEKDLIDLENKRIADQELFESEFERRAEQLEIQRQQEIANAEKTGADVNIINEKFAKFRKILERDVNQFKIQQNARTFEMISALLGQESNLGKIVALTAIANNTIQKATEAFNIASVLAANPLTAALAPNAYVQAGLIVAQGALQATKIVAPKLEKGGVIDIGGKRHSAGGTKFVGDDGTAFEAEQGEKLFVLNRAASAAIAPVLSQYNQKYGGAALSTRSSYLAAGGEVLRASAPPNVETINYEKLASYVTEGARMGTMEGSYQGSSRGSLEGSRQGSSLGTYEGMVDRTENEIIEAGANF